MKKTNRVLLLVLGVAILLCLGLIYGWSIFVAPLEAEFGWARTETSLTFTISISCFCLGGLIAGIVSRKTGPRLPLIASAIFLAAGFALSSRVSTLMGIYLSYGVLCSLGVGFSYNVLINVMNRWFPDKPGLVSGVLLMGFGCGGMVLGSVATGLMGAMGWRSTFLVFAVLFGAVVFLGSFFLRYPRKEDALPPPAAPKGNAPAGLDLNAPQMLKRPSFWFYALWGTLLPAGGLMLIGNASPILTELQCTAALATFGVGFLSVCNGAGRVLFGAIYDRSGRKPTMTLITGSFLLSGLALWWAFGAGAWFPAFLAFLFMGLAYGGVPTVNAAFVQTFYGKTHFATNFPVLNLTLMVSSLGGPPIAAALQQSSGSYAGVAFLVLIAGVLGGASMFFVRKP